MGRSDFETEHNWALIFSLAADKSKKIAWVTKDEFLRHNARTLEWPIHTQKEVGTDQYQLLLY